jgi:RNA polymerase sigma-70 factor (ECF subfamily)
MLKLKDDLVGCLRNDKNSKERIYKAFYGYTMGVISRYITDRSDSEELVNDSFIKIFKNISQFSFPQDPEDLNKAFRGWVARISSRSAIDFLRTRRTYLYIEDITEYQHPIGDVNVISKLHVQDILSLLYALPEMHRLIFNMYEIEGFSHDEIAEMLNIPVSSSRVYLTRAKNKLRTLYSNTLIQSYATK